MISQNNKTYPQWFFVGLVLVASLVEVLFLLHIHHKNLAGYSEDARGIVLGTPPWQAFQNRLLGPWMAWGAARVFGHTYETWFLVLTGVLWAGANVVTYWCAYKLTGSQRIAAGAAATSILLTVVLEGPQGALLYLWDPLDVLLLTVFAYGLFAKKGVGFFVLLFAVELLNREAALFIALWLVIDSFQMKRSGGGRRLALTQPVRLAVGAALVVVGVAWTKFIRDVLFKHSTLFMNDEHIHMALGNFWTLSANAHSLFQVLVHPAPIGVVSLMICPALVAFLFWHRRDYNEDFLKVLLLLTIMASSVLSFAVFTELRTWLDLLPLLILLHLAMGQQRVRRALASPVAEPAATLG